MYPISRFVLTAAVAALPLLAQFPGLSLPPSGDNQKASVTQYIGPVRVTIDYSSPRVTLNGQDRRGKLWGQLVPYGMTNLGFGTAKLGPWRAGANENTVFTVSESVTIEGQQLAAGSYGLHMIVEKDAEWTLIFSKNHTSWGSFYYDESEDALRVKVKPRAHAFWEWLTYEFTERKPAEALVEMQWEEIAAPWRVAVADIHSVYISGLRKQLRTVPGFTWQGFVQAAQYTLQSGRDLEQGLAWADSAIGMPFVGQENFTTLQMKAQLLEKLGKKDESAQWMDKAIRHATAAAGQIHMYGRTLMAAGKVNEAFQVYPYNAQRFGEQWPTHVGMARAYSAKGDYAKALEHAKKALVQAPDPVNRKSLESMVEKLSAGQKVE